MAHHIIYVPGIGDHKTYGQNIGIQIWRLFGLRPHYFPLGWSTKEGFDAKLARLLKQIDRLFEQGHTVSLVGVSAGASAVLTAYNERPKIARVVCIVGKIQRPETIKSSTYRINPDFKESMQRVGNSIGHLQSRGQVKNILSLRPLRDKSVPLEDMKITGATIRTVPAWSHASGVLMGVILGAPIIAKFLHSTK